ncbi:MAG: ferritin family protein, partial [archaeon]|nr:ferritin family protein [archaeon]
ILAEVSDPVTDLPLNDSADCLRSAIDSETLDVNDYTGFAKTAREEGYDSVAEYLEEIVAADRKHQQKFQRVLDELESDQ